MSRFKYLLSPQIIAVLLVGIAIGFGAGYWKEYGPTATLRTAVQNSLVPVQVKGQQYTLVKPLLAYRTPEAVTYGEYTELKDAMSKDINTLIGNGSVDRLSVYFRDLDTGRWVGINQNDMYYPASLLKVPLLIAYYDQAAKNPDILNQSYFFPGVEVGPYESTSTLKEGQNYRVSDLIKSMIVDSDNGATLTLLNHMSSKALASVYASLGISEPGNGSNYVISTRTYALFFRVLYNATFITPEYSQKALELLTKDDYKDGLVKPLPLSFKVAHKWGQHVVMDKAGLKAVGLELHDCGIIYYPGHPYLLCVMTSADDTPNAQKAIQLLSKTTYESVAKRYPQD